ncbi:unnamed protein product [Spirodela intermedia]|uniref:Iron hydrogenase small subunit domain-containing protein n=1 Tax=Spirodela intermedia TaxID=51605 RepID=A0A7I8INN2_SPIIN|nr:unnamed protein product [Spirodela intermedia]CAA6659184.1 unnamed protein product [Spirodela intermedia]
MSEKFSPALRLADLNDFIAPSQGCINAGSKPPQTDPVKISLKDCLACSGCITSAETVMLEKQSLDEFLSQINSEKAVIVSLSPQSRASLAAYFNLSPSQEADYFLEGYGCKGRFDTSCSRDISLIESCNEFIFQDINKITTLKKKILLILGWICYAEKTLGSYILPYISSVKSPQQAMGAAIKHHICEKMGIRPESIYHVTVMPCYDKKLEAARDDFVFSVDHDGEGRLTPAELRIPEVDSVLTSGEILDLIQSSSVDFESLAEAPLDRLLTNVDEEGRLFGVNGGSGGYAETVFRHAAKKLFGKELPGPLDFRILRNADLQELTLEVEGEVVLRFALCYGFRNLQNIVRKIKIRKCDYHFIEIMACPSGCLNGGGQLKPKTGQTVKEAIQSLQVLYMQDVAVSDPFDNPIVKGLYDEWLRFPRSETAKKYMHTGYHPVLKSVSPTSKAGDPVSPTPTPTSPLLPSL